MTLHSVLHSVLGRSVEGKTVPPKKDVCGRVYPGVSVFDLLEGQDFEGSFPVIGYKDGSFDGDFKVGFDISLLLGVKVELNLSEAYRQFKESYDNINKSMKDGSRPTNKFDSEPFKKEEKIKMAPSH